MRKTLPLVLALGLGVAHAGDSLNIEQVRFSPDGTRVMVFTQGVQDGSGFNYFAVSILNTSTGQTILSKSRAGEADYDAIKTQVLNSPAVKAAMQVNRVWPGVTSKPRYQRTFPEYTLEFAGGSMAGQSQTTAVRLWTVPVPIKLTVFKLPTRCSVPEAMNELPSVGLSLVVGKQELLRDKVAQPCVMAYALQRVDVQGNRALITVRAYSPGFEGPNGMPRFIAATLK